MIYGNHAYTHSYTVCFQFIQTKSWTCFDKTVNVAIPKPFAPYICMYVWACDISAASITFRIKPKTNCLKFNAANQAMEVSLKHYQCYNTDEKKRNVSASIEISSICYDKFCKWTTLNVLWCVLARKISILIKSYSQLAIEGN